MHSYFLIPVIFMTKTFYSFAEIGRYFRVYFQHGIRIINAGKKNNIKQRPNSWLMAGIKYIYFYLTVLYSLFFIKEKPEFISTMIKRTLIIIKGNNYYFGNIGLPENKCELAFVYSTKDRIH